MGGLHIYFICNDIFYFLMWAEVNEFEYLAIKQGYLQKIGYV